MDREQQPDAIVRIVTLGNSLAISDDMVVTITPHSRGKVEMKLDRTSGCGAALLASRLGKGERPGRPVIRRMD